ncbi:MAG TPA: alanine--tRNA ligase-related protein [Candidatus Paceibacterota bacterium]
MESQEIRDRFLKFFKDSKHGEHKIMFSSSLIPDDPSVLLTTAGMQQFKKYYTEPSLAPAKNVVSIQKCFRTSDIDEVGDESHLTFFEMLGNFSFGGYFKKEAIEYAHEFITKELELTIDYVSVFGGEDSISADEESEKIWNLIDKKIKIKKFGKSDNFWGPTGSEGPCGPTSEIYVNGVEIWNLVFNEYYCNKDGSIKKLETPGVDTGMGLERLAMVVQNKKNIFETDLFEDLIAVSKGLDERKRRIASDHARGVMFLIADGVVPSNKEAGYILRRLLRRIIFLKKGGIDFENMFELIEKKYKSFYPELSASKTKEVFEEEYAKFNEALQKGLEEMDKMKEIDSESAFTLFETFGIPFELTKEMAKDRAKNLTREDFDKEFKKHQEISRAGAEKKFGGHGLLLNTGELKAKDEEELKIVTRLHTATHLLQASLRKVLGDEVKQAGSDITVERTRFDFSYSRKPTDEEIKKVEDLVNDVISKKLFVSFEEMPIEEAKKTGALFFFKEKYPEKVKVYYAGDSIETAFSKEFCGGPHVKNTSEIGKFKIQKSESIGSSTRRIRATIEQ